jgi:hypothetical protein
MPYTMRKNNNKPCYRVVNQKTRRVYARCSTKENAQKQLRLLRAIKYNKKFIPLASLRRRLRKTLARRMSKGG